MAAGQNEVLFDTLLQYHLGEFGRFQWLIVLVMSYGWIYSAFQVMSSVFVAAVPLYACAHAPGVERYIEYKLACRLNSSADVSPPLDAKFANCFTLPLNLSGIIEAGANDTCAERSSAYEAFENISFVPCSSFLYDTSEFSSTLVTEWNLVCGQKWKASTVASAFMAGFTLGNVVFGFLADRFGRRRVVLVAGLSNIAVTLVSAFSPTYSFYIVLRFLQALLFTGNTNTSFVHALEYCGPSRRVLVGAMMGCFWALGYMILAGIGYLVRDWRTLTLVLTLSELSYYVLYFFLVPESPRWLYLRGRVAEADKVVQKMAKVNRVVIPSDIRVKSETGDDTKTYLDLIKTPMIRMLSLVMLFNWAANGFVYYGLSLNVGNLGGNPYLNFVISGAVELPAYVFIWFSFNLFGRLWPFAASLVGGGLANLLILAVPAGNDLAVIILSMIGKFFVSVSFQMAWVYSCEVYPTCIRNLGLQVIGVSARLASIIAPYVGLLDAYGQAIPSVIFGSVSLVAAGLMFLLPETKGRPMAQTVEEGEQLISRNHPTLCRRRPRDQRNGKAPTMSEDPEVLKRMT